ncbi:hypothetical protein V8C86DRAFT_2728199, partial [Haematococcus lacustris]
APANAGCAATHVSNLTSVLRSHAFHGHMCLLAGLASASTAAVSTIVAAPTEAEQADAAPASGASNGIYKKRSHIHSYADKMQFAHRSAKILVFSSTGVKKVCDDLTASGLNLSQILTDVELLYPSLYKLISMLADTDATMRGAAAQAIIDAYRQHVQWCFVCHGS